VSALAFMSPDADSEAVIARTPMERRARDAGARMERREGWNVAVDYGDYELERTRLERSTGFADRSSLTKLELQAEPEVLAAIVATAAGGLSLSTGTASLVDGVWWCPVTPARVLALAESAGAAGLRAGIDGAVAQAGGQGEATITVLDLTSALAGLTLAGPTPPGRRLRWPSPGPFATVASSVASRGHGWRKGGWPHRVYDRRDRAVHRRRHRGEMGIDQPGGAARVARCAPADARAARPTA